MIVESEDFFATPKKNTPKSSARFLSLVQRPASAPETWDIVLNGVNTKVNFTRKKLNNFRGDPRGLEMMIRGLEYSLMHFHYTLQAPEKKELRKLINTLL